MSWDIPQIAAAGIFPSVELIDVFSQQIKKNKENETVYASEIDTEGEGAIEEDEVAAMITDGSGTGSTDTDISSMVSEGVERGLEDDIGDDEWAVDHPRKVEPSKVSKFFKIASLPDNTRLAMLVERFVDISKTDGKYYICDHANLVLVSNWLHSIPLTLAERCSNSITCS